MKAFEFTAAVGNLFTCIVGEPRGWTCNPPRSHIPVIEEPMPDEKKHWYAVFGYQCSRCTEEELVNALYSDFQSMRAMCSNAMPTPDMAAHADVHRGGVGAQSLQAFPQPTRHP